MNKKKLGLAGAVMSMFVLMLVACHNTNNTGTHPPVVITVPPIIDTPGDLPPIVIEPSTPGHPPGISIPVPNPLTSDPNDEILIQLVLANGESEEVTRAPAENSDDRAVIFGNNYPGSSAALNECVNDAYKNALNLIKVDKFDPKNIRLFLNSKCTAANYKKWILWAIKEGRPGESRRFIANSSHGSQDTTPDGKTVGIIVTHDMIATGSWSPEHEISFQWLYDNLRTNQSNWTMLLDQCYAGGAVRFMLTPQNRKIRSIEPAPAAQARIDKAVESANAQVKFTELTGFVNPACAANELSSEDPTNGGEGTEAYWRARRALGPNPLTTDIVREENKFLRSIQATQHMQLIGWKSNLWGRKPVPAPVP